MEKIVNLIKYYVQMFFLAYFSAYYATKFVIWQNVLKNKMAIFAICDQWSKKLLKIGGIKIKVHGSLPKDSSNFVYVSNHSSLWDIPLILSAVDDNIRIMYKKELEKIPIFGYGLKKSPFIAVKREEARNAMSSIESTVKSMKEGSSVLVYPEGTRSKDGNIGEFKRGAFLLAEKAGKPIIPLTIIGSFDIMGKGKKEIKSSIINIYIGSVINVNENMTRLEEKELMQNVHIIMKSNLDKYKTNNAIV